MSNRNDNPVWVIAEQIRGKIPPVCLELVGQARKLADDLGASTEVLLLEEVTPDQIDLLFYSGAGVVYQGNSSDFDIYQSEIYSETRELAPIIAAKLGTGLTAHCMDLVLNEEYILEQRIPAYGGLISIICPEKRPQIATIAQGVFPVPELDETRSGKIVPVEPPAGFKARVKTLEVVIKEPEGMPLEEAPIVVAGGSGAGNIEGWQEIETLADVLNAALGSTRPAVDEGWTDLDTMIGQSGKMVNPELYIGVGLSGEQQHMVGIANAKVMVAINNDPKSPVFEQVDYGIVEDCREFIPVLVEKLQEKLKWSRT